MIQLSVKLFLQAEDTFSIRSLLLYGTIYLPHSIITRHNLFIRNPAGNYGSDSSDWYCFFDNGMWNNDIYMAEQIVILLYVLPISKNIIILSDSTFFLHIGIQKTGSTTIQQILQQNIKELKKEKIKYLGRLPVLARKIRVMEEHDPAIIHTLRQQIKEEMGDESFSGNYILSNEKFAGDKMVGYKNTPVIAETVFKALEPLDVNVKIIVFLRRQDDFLESTYAPRIYSGSTLTFEEFFKNFDTSHFHWDELVDSYADYFGPSNVIVHRYDQNFLPHKDSLINLFGDSVGSSFLKNYSETKIHNSGFIRDTLEIERIANNYLDKQEKKYLRDLLRKVGSKDLYEKYSFFNISQRKEFLNNYMESNARVACKYLQDKSGTLFSPLKPGEYDISPYEGLTADKAVLHLTRAILESRSNQVAKNSDKRQNHSYLKRFIRKLLR